MKSLFTQKYLLVIIILFLVFVGAFTHLIQEGFWANIHSQGMIRIAKEHWYYSAYPTALIGGVRWKILEFYNYRMDKLVQQGKINDARKVCDWAKMIWDQEGAVSYKCQILDQLAP